MDRHTHQNNGKLALTLSTGLNGVLPQIQVHLERVTVFLFENRVFAGVIS